MQYGTCLGTVTLVMVSFNASPHFHADRLYPLAGNLHLNIAAAAYTPEIESALEPFVYELVGESLEPVKVPCPQAYVFSSGSILQGVNLRRAWDWSDEDPRGPLFEISRCH